MGYGFRDGDIISLANPKAGALTLSVPFQDYRDPGLVTPENMWRTQTAIRSVVGFKAKSIAGVPFHLYRRAGDGGRTRVHTGSVAKSLQTPAPRLGQTRFVQQLMFDMSIYGRWAFLVDDTDDGLQFLRLPAEKIAVVIDGLGRYTGLATRIKGEWLVRGLDDVVFDVSVGPTATGGKARGWSDVETLSDLALELSGLGEYRRTLFRNQAMVPAVVERPKDAGKWSDEAWKRFKADISSYRAGGPNAGGWPVLEEGMTLRPIEVFDPSKAEYVQVRELHLIEAAQALNLPPELVGAREGTHSNILALREQLYVDVLGPDISAFQEALNAGLSRWMKDTQYIEVNFDAKLRGSLQDRAKIYQSATGAPWLTVNEVRELENRPKLDGGDELVRPLNVTQGGQASPQDSAPEDNGQDEKDGKLARTGRKADEPDPKVRFAAVDKAAAHMEKAVRDWFAGYAARLADHFGVPHGLPDDAKAISVGYKPRPTMPTTEQEQAEADDLAGILNREAKKVALLTGTVLAAGYAGDLVPDFGRQDAWLAKASMNNAARAVAHTRNSILAPAMVTLEPVELETLLRQAIFGTALAHFDMVSTLAATEAHTFGARDTAEQLKLQKKTWWTTSKTPRESHKAQSGVQVGKDDYFPNGCRFPGDWDGGTDEVVNCRCRVSYE